MKTYVVCIDGTWNHPSQMDKDPRTQDVESVTETNVLRVFRYLAGHLHANTFDLQRTMIAPLNPRFSEDTVDLGTVLYLSGIGTNRGFLQRQYEGATGSGTWDRILSAYGFLAERCQPDDQIFGFGFSRGAFAVRSLAGLIYRVGLPQVPHSYNQLELDAISRAYRQGGGSTSGLSNHRAADIQFLGLWDTVGAMAFDRAVGRSQHEISPPNVQHVAHALALDEERGDFTPEFWQPSGNKKLVNEVWFAGAHSNIGGGYQDPELSNIALAWVFSQAIEAELPKYPNYVQGWYAENTYGFRRNSYEEFLKNVRVIGNLMKGSPRPRVIRDDQAIHASVFDRVDMVKVSDYVTGPPRKQQDLERYAPAASMANGQRFPTARKLFKGRIVETPDYLSGQPAKV